MQRNESWNEITHSEAFELLPWLVNDTLSRREHVAVEKHVDSCPVCSQEIDEQRSLRELVRDSSVVPLPTSKSFNQLVSRIDASETKVSESRFVGWRRPYRIAATLAMVSVSVLLMIVVIDGPGSEDEFVTLTESGSQGSAGPTLHVIFESDITEADMRAALLVAGGEILRGPTPGGIYTIGIAGSSEGSNDIDGLLNRLRANPHVRLAEQNYQNVTE